MTAPLPEHLRPYHEGAARGYATSASTIKLRSDWHRAGAGQSVRFDLRGQRLDAEWRPHLLTKREWKRMIERYRIARDEFLCVMAAERFRTVLVLEVPLDGDAEA
jgi:hypothetical protein